VLAALETVRPLIVQHKPTTDFDFEKMVRARLSSDTIPVHFLTCGQHDATNKFANVSNVILAGTLIKPNPVYETLGRLAAALPSSSDPFEETATVKRGEHCHGVLQANARECCLAATERRCAANPIFVNAKNVLTTTVTNAKAATRPAPRNLNVRRRSSRS
jgi:hypothetical protein